MADTLINLLTELQDLVSKLEAIGFGSDTESVTHNGVTRASVAKQIRDKYDGFQEMVNDQFGSIQAMVEGQIPYETLALATAAGEPSTVTIGGTDYHRLVRVIDDPVAENNGIWYWNGSALARSNYDIINIWNDYRSALDVQQSTHEQTVNDRIGPISARELSAESGYAWALVDAQSGRAAVRVRTDGTLVAEKMELPTESVGSSQLTPALGALVAQELSAESGYAWALVDAQSGRAAVRVRTDGTLVAEKFEAGDESVSTNALTPALARNIVPQISDRVAAFPVSAWRPALTDIATQTAPGDGSGWVPFPDRPVRCLYGPNQSGTSIDIRKSAGLVFKGQSYAGSFSPGSVASIRHVGTFSGPSVSTPSGDFMTGDFYYYANGSGAVSSGTWPGMNVGDLLVYDGTSWSVQVAPGNFGDRDRHAFWRVSEPGVFNGLTLDIDDVLLYIGRQTGGGGWQYERWSKVKAGDCCYWGEFNPSNGLPAQPVNGAVWQADSAGTAGSIAFSADDYAMFDGAEWVHLPNEPHQSVANSESISLRCLSTAAEWEVRRTDKAATRSGVRLRAQASTKSRRSNSDGLWLLSDSMFGVSNVGGLVLQKSGRTGVVNSFGGSTSEQVVGMMEYEIAELGDRYAGHVLIAWHGQNNQPSTESASAQIKEATLRMLELASCRDQRAVFLTVLGQRASAWNGARLVVSQHEDQMAGTGILHDLVQWYDAILPGQYLNTYAALIAAATDAPDPQFPGMSEKQVASEYGIVPFSFWNYYYDRIWETSDLNYVGTWSYAGLPSSSANQYDYYIRIGSGTHGNLIVYEGGAWVERSIDFTHLSPAGADALSSAITNFLTDHHI
jgi:hypothetical protein